MNCRGVLILAAICAAIAQPSYGKIRNKAIDDLKSTLEKIKADLLNMRPSIKAAAGLVDAYVPQHQEETQESIDAALVQLNEKNIPRKCFQEAEYKLNALKDVVVPNCSAVHIIEDAGSMAYNSVNFLALSMVTLDDVLQGLDQCQPWYEFWHYIPCVVSYAWTSYKDLKDLVSDGYQAFEENLVLFKEIRTQISCKKMTFAVQLSSSDIVNEAYLCSKNSL